MSHIDSGPGDEPTTEDMQERLARGIPDEHLADGGIVTGILDPGGPNAGLGRTDAHISAGPDEGAGPQDVNQEDLESDET